MAPSTVLPDYYAFLGVPQSANAATIKSRYHKLALEKHPDRRRDEPNATADFQRLNEAYEVLRDTDKRRQYDVAYQATVQPRQIENKRIAELEKKLQQLKAKRMMPENLLYNLKKDLTRLYAETDSLKGEKERIAKEKASKETWWLYTCSLVSGTTAEFGRQKQQRDHLIETIIGKHRTTEYNIDLKLKEAGSVEESIRSISIAEDKIKVEMRQIEAKRHSAMVFQEAERVFAELRKKRTSTDRNWSRPNPCDFSSDYYWQ